MFDWIARNPIPCGAAVLLVGWTLLFWFGWYIGLFEKDENPQLEEPKRPACQHVRIVSTLAAARELLDSAERDGSREMTCEDVAGGYVVKWVTESTKCACGEGGK